MGNCGFSAYPAAGNPQVLRDFANGIFADDDRWGWDSASDIVQARANQNRDVASLVGHGSLRIKVAGNTSRALTSREIEQCRVCWTKHWRKAPGFLLGPDVRSRIRASPEELTALCGVVARRGGVYATHMRSYSEGLVEAVEEQISIAEASGCRLQSLSPAGRWRGNWHLQQPAIAAIEQASARGMDVAFDAYPWLAGSTVLTQVLPQTALDGGIPQMLARLRDPQQRESIRTKIKPEARWTGVVITSAAHDEASLVGRSIQDIASERGDEPEDVVMDILLEQEGNVMIVEHCQSIENLHALLTHPLAIVITDGVYTMGVHTPASMQPSLSCLATWSVSVNGLVLVEAVHKVSAKPARIQFARSRTDRGRLCGRRHCIRSTNCSTPAPVMKCPMFRRQASRQY